MIKIVIAVIIGLASLTIPAIDRASQITRVSPPAAKPDQRDDKHPVGTPYPTGAPIVSPEPKPTPGGPAATPIAMP